MLAPGRHLDNYETAARKDELTMITRRKKHALVTPLVILLGYVFSNCSTALAQQPDPLPSWTEGSVKSAIIQFVDDVTNAEGAKYVPPEQRIATFDNDGTLWCEQPVVQIAFAIQRVKQMAPAHPEWKDRQPYKAVLAGDEQYLINDLLSGGHAILEVVEASHAGISRETFQQDVREFFETAKHPKFNVPYTKAVYAPMLELLAYLRGNGFKTYICSGGGIDFMRVVSETTYGISPENVIGSNARDRFEKIDGKWQLMKTGEDLFVNDKTGKPVGIDLHIGRKPIFAAGNVRSGGDISMLTYCHSNQLPSLQVLVNHDDADREFAYSEKDSASLNAAREQGWQVVSMKSDWKQIFSFREE
jgi:phosphoglycolate phosphatase-like HAD superfamily hydrolase